MAKTLQFRRGTTAEISAITGAAGELFVDLSKDTLVVMDGNTQGGQALQKELISGTNVKTVNGNSLLGSGNIAVQEILTSGTNVKTVNGNSLLGSGNVTVQETLISGVNVKTFNGTSLLGSGNIQIEDVDFTQIYSDIVPGIGEVYDLGSIDNPWYKAFFKKSVIIDDIEIESTDGNLVLGVSNDLITSAETIVTNADILVNSILTPDLFINQNIIKPLNTPLYGQREVIVEGGLTIASHDPAYIKLSQLLGTTTNIVEYNVNFSAQTYIGYYADTSLIIYPDIGPILQAFLGDSSHNGEMWIAKSNNSYSINNPSKWNTFKAEAGANLIPGKTYTITFGPGWKIESNYSNTGTFSPGSYEAEYVGLGTYAVGPDTLEFLIFKTPVELTGVWGLTVDTNYWFNDPNNDRNTAYFLNISKQEIEEETIIDDSVLATYGSEGMLRFNPITKSFEGHNGTEWGPIGGSSGSGSEGASGIPEISPGVFQLEGELIVTGDITSLSDASVKENIKPIQNALSSVLNLQGVTYNMIGSTKKSLGFVANHAENIVPELVNNTKNGLKGVAYANAVALLVEAIKEQQFQIEELRAKLNDI